MNLQVCSSQCTLVSLLNQEEHISDEKKVSPRQELSHRHEMKFQGIVFRIFSSEEDTLMAINDAIVCEVAEQFRARQEFHLH